VTTQRTYAQLLSPHRLRPTSIAGRTPELESLSDTGRIIASSAFRRLQTKAQVFSLERNAAVRTRLTHSLEVATFGQFIAERTFELLVQRGVIEPSLRLPFVQTVQNACLLHDIGNPPFGHLGEFAIRDWFAKRQGKIAEYWRTGGMKEDAIQAHLNSFIHFDGNPQGLRIVTRLMWLKDAWGLNLTCALMASTVKYLGAEPATDKPFRRKIGFFEAERDRIFRIWTTLGLATGEDRDLAQRHPFAFLMEAADDIAYCLSDIEDALEKGVCSQSEFFSEISSILPSLLPDAQAAADEVLNASKGPEGIMKANNASFIEFSRSVTRQLTEMVSMSFADNEAAIRNGEYYAALLDGHPVARSILDALKGFAKRRIFVAREAIEIELGGFRIVQTLLDGYEALLCLTPDDFRRLEPNGARPLKYGELARESRLHTLLPNKHWLAYSAERRWQPAIEPALRTHLIVDYITGMTDSFALKIFHMLMGTSHPTLEG